MSLTSPIHGINVQCLEGASAGIQKEAHGPGPGRSMQRNRKSPDSLDRSLKKPARPALVSVNRPRSDGTNCRTGTRVDIGRRWPWSSLKSSRFGNNQRKDKSWESVPFGFMRARDRSVGAK